MINSHMHEGYLQLSIYVLSPTNLYQSPKVLNIWRPGLFWKNHCVHKVGRVHPPEFSTTGVRLMLVDIHLKHTFHPKMLILLSGDYSSAFFFMKQKLLSVVIYIINFNNLKIFNSKQILHAYTCMYMCNVHVYICIYIYTPGLLFQRSNINRCIPLTM